MVTEMSLLSDPSIMKLLLRERWPFTEYVPCPVLDETFGDWRIRLLMFRAAPPRGSSVTCLAVRVMSTVGFVLFSSIASALAVTVTLHRRPSRERRRAA